jgi:hypothetical protein
MITHKETMVSAKGEEWEFTWENDPPMIRTIACHIASGECLSYEIDSAVPKEMLEQAIKDFANMLIEHPLGGRLP